jgi:hypothetical protein
VLPVKAAERLRARGQALDRTAIRVDARNADVMPEPVVDLNALTDGRPRRTAGPDVLDAVDEQ